VAARVVAAQRSTRRTHLRRRQQPYFTVIAPVLVGVLRDVMRVARYGHDAATPASSGWIPLFGGRHLTAVAVLDLSL